MRVTDKGYLTPTACKLQYQKFVVIQGVYYIALHNKILLTGC